MVDGGDPVHLRAHLGSDDQFGDPWNVRGDGSCDGCDDRDQLDDPARSVVLDIETIFAG